MESLGQETMGLSKLLAKALAPQNEAQDVRLKTKALEIRAQKKAEESVRIQKKEGMLFELKNL